MNNKQTSGIDKERTIIRPMQDNETIISGSSTFGVDLIIKDQIHTKHR